MSNKQINNNIIDITNGISTGISERNFIRVTNEFGIDRTCEQYTNLKKIQYLGWNIGNPIIWLRNAIKNNYVLELSWKDKALCSHIDIV